MGERSKAASDFNGWHLAAVVFGLLVAADLFLASYTVVTVSAFGGSYSYDCGSGYSVLLGRGIGECATEHRGAVALRLAIGSGLIWGVWYAGERLAKKRSVTNSPTAGSVSDRGSAMQPEQQSTPAAAAQATTLGNKEVMAAVLRTGDRVRLPTGERTVTAVQFLPAGEVVITFDSGESSTVPKGHYFSKVER